MSDFVRQLMCFTGVAVKNAINRTENHAFFATSAIQSLIGMKNIQIEMLEYVKSTQRAKIRGDINTLSDVMSNYKFNCNNEKYKTNKHILVQDIKKESEQALSLHTEQIVKTLNKSDDWHWDNDVKQVKK